MAGTMRVIAGQAGHIMTLIIHIRQFMAMDTVVTCLRMIPSTTRSMVTGTMADITVGIMAMATMDTTAIMTTMAVMRMDVSVGAEMLEAKSADAVELRPMAVRRIAA